MMSIFGATARMNNVQDLIEIEFGKKSGEELLTRNTVRSALEDDAVGKSSGDTSPFTRRGTYCEA